MSRKSLRVAALAVGAVAILGSLAIAGPAVAAPTPTFTLYPTPTTGAGTSHIVVGPDGNLWFTEATGNNIGKITPAGVIT